MSRFLLSTRIGAAISFSLILLGLLAVVSYGSTTSIGNTFAEYRTTASQTLLMSKLTRNLFEAQMAASQYRISESEDAATEVRASVERILAVSEQAEALLKDDPAARDAVENAQKDAASYAAAFDQMLGLQKNLNALVVTLTESGEQTQKALSEIMVTAYLDDTPEAAYHAGVAVQQILLGRYHANAYLLSNDPAAFEQAQSHLAKFSKRMGLMQPKLSNPEHKGLAGQAQTQFDLFSETLAAIRDVVVERNGVRKERLDVLGPKMLAEFEHVVDSVVDRQGELGFAGRATVDATLALVLSLSIGAVLLGAIGGFLLSRGVSRDVAAMADKMKALAAGDMSQSLEGAEHDNELGRMAQALIVFKQNAERVASLQQEQNLKDAEAAQQRADMMTELRRSFGDVVDAAVKGDFSKRISANFPDSELNELAEGLNQLLQTVSDGLGETGRVLSQVAKGDLTDKMHGRFQGAFAELKDNVNRTVEQLSDLVAQISVSVDSVQCGAGEITDGAQDLSGRAEQQANSLEETAATMEEMSASIKSNADNASSAQSLARDASSRADKGGSIVKDAVSAMNAIEAGAAKIADIISVIDSIAFQTNLLALNAAVEAARAGDAGKGFAVVASEVRALAQRSSGAAHDIRGLIESSATQVSEGVRLVTETGGALEGIADAIAQVGASIDNIAQASKEQATGVEEISTTIGHMDQMTQQNSSLAERTVSHARTLQQSAEELQRLVAFFAADASPGGERESLDAA